SGERVALQNRLASQVTLKDVVAMQLVALAQFVAHVARPLINVDRGCAGADELIRAEVGAWNQSEQLLDCRVSYTCPLRICWRDAADRKPLALACSFVAKEEKRPVLEDRSAERGAKLIAFEGWLIQVAILVAIGQVEDVSRVEIIIAQKLESLA